MYREETRTGTSSVENMVPGPSHTPDSPAGAGTAGWECPCSSPSSAPLSWPRRTVLSRASLSGPVPFKPLELFPAVP